MSHNEELRATLISYLLAFTVVAAPILIIGYGVVLYSLTVLLVFAGLINLAYGLRPRWRFWQWLYAITHGYYWIACPLCGRYFGGHEDNGSWYHGRGWGKSVCLNCRETADVLTQIQLDRESKQVYPN